jgi:hypothetical protein
MVGRGSGSLGSDVIVIFCNFSPYDFHLEYKEQFAADH